MSEKLSSEEIQQQFDRDVARFTNETTGQQTIVDAPLVLAMVEEMIARLYPDASTLCDIGCGGGNFSLRIARKLPQLNVTLLDLSGEMLAKAQERLTAENLIVANAIQGDIRNTELAERHFDIVVASAVLHHLRTREEWHNVFSNIYRSLKPGGSFWMSDLIKHENGVVETYQKERYAEYLVNKLGKDQQERSFQMIEASDTPETPTFLVRTLESVGFHPVDIIHKNMTFATFVAFKAE